MGDPIFSKFVVEDHGNKSSGGFFVISLFPIKYPAVANDAETKRVERSEIRLTGGTFDADCEFQSLGSRAIILNIPMSHREK